MAHSDRYVRSRTLWLVTVVLAVLAGGATVVGCGLTGSDHLFPEPDKATASDLARAWTGAGASLDLRSGGTFRSRDLSARYYSCKGVAEVDPESRQLTGIGTWTIGSGRDSTSVSLNFTDSGCTATFWAGQDGGHRVVWTQLGTDDVLKLS